MPLGERGSIRVHVPYCDIPVNKLFASVFLPTGYKYGEFTGKNNHL